VYVQVLRLAITVRTNEREVLDALRFLAHRAQQPDTPVTRVECLVRRHGAQYEVSANGAVIDSAPSPVSVLETLFAFTQSRALALFDEHALVRGAVVGTGGARALLIGERGCGLTSLCVRSLHLGAAAEGDAFALLGADGVTPLPRRFLLRAGAGELLPELGNALERLPAISSNDDVIRAFDPAEAGFEWQIRRGPVDACVVIEPNHGGETRLTTIGETEMVRRVMACCTPPVAGGREWLHTLSALVTRAACWRLQLGTIDAAAPAVIRVLA